jgi:hypothetical protein
MNYKLLPEEDILKKQRYIVKFRGSLYDYRDAMRTWCSENFGPNNSSYKNPRWSEDWAGFYFKNEGDMMLFMLRWS